MSELPAHMRPERSFQGLILALQRFWADHGCVILQPYDMEVGAGTFHPATTLRALGPRPWAAAYVQPSRRPTDGRYGENPNRLQHYYQFQVLLKPSPDDSQDLYLQSLYHLGIDAAVALLAIAASVYIVYLLEIIKLANPFIRRREELARAERRKIA